MPTIPNPTPGTDPAPDPMPEDPTPTEPTIPPVVRSKPTLILDRLMKRSKAEIEFEDKTMHSALLISNFQDHSREQYPELAMFKTWCPGNYSRRYTDKAAAAALSSGSGYFGYPVEGVFGSAGWWSTNFVDRATEVGTATKWEGEYFSKNHCLGSASQITCSVTLDGPDVYLKWGTQWAVVTKNALYDKLGADGKYYPEGGRVPRKENGDVDVDLLELLIMQEAPTYGAFVIVDFYNDYYHFAAMDGAHEQYTKLDEPNRPSRDMPFDESVLPLSSRLSFLPSFSATPVLLDPAALNSTASYTTMPAATVYDRVTPWRNVLTDYAGVSTGSALESLSAAQAQSSTTLLFKTASDPRYFQTNLSAAFTSSSGAKIYSGLIRNGKPTQMVCYAHRRLFFSLGYGTTSVAPGAAVAGKYTYLLTTDNVQQEILSKMPAIANISIGFIYDASVGDFGEVTWLSQL